MRIIPIFALSLGLCFLLFQQSGSSQDDSSSLDSRAYPAPWRPQFGETSGLPAEQTPIDNDSPNNLSEVDVTAIGSPESNAVAVPNSTGLAPETRTNAPDNQSGQTNSSPAANGLGNGVTKVTRTMNMLPNAAGQIWREYDISPYTSQITSIQNPQQAILDWILRETGTEMWFNQPMGILNADRDHIYVYHTPEIQNAVQKIVDRFVNTRGQVQVVDINLVTVENPNWRSNVYSMLQPVDVQSPGVEAWMISKENAAQLLSQLSRRLDFSQHSTGRLFAHDGQNLVLEKYRPRQFVRNIRWAANQSPAYQPLLSTIDEGYKLSISSLSTLDGRLIEAAIKCDVDQIENLTTVKVDLPSATPGRVDQMDLQIPQLVSWRLHERFRWPNDQVLLLSCGVVAKPDPQAPQPGNLPRLFNVNRNRADALVFIEYRGPAGPGQFSNLTTPASTTNAAGTSTVGSESARLIPVESHR